MSAADTITAATVELAGMGYSSLVHADLTAHARSGPVKRWRVRAVHRTVPLAVVEATAAEIDDAYLALVNKARGLVVA